MHSSVSYFKGLLLFLSMSLVIISCKKDDDIVTVTPTEHQRAEILDIKSIGIYTVEEIQQLMVLSGQDFDMSLNQPVATYSVKYYTVNHNGDELLVSGALLVPEGRTPKGMISIQHGTLVKKEKVASVSPESSVEGTIGLFFSSMGYISLIPDYPGFGASNISHPYMHAESLVPSVVDLILAAKEYCMQNGIDYKDHLFLTGYSEGGFVSLAAQKEIEESYRDQIKLSGVAPLAGPYDLRNTYDKMFSDADFCEPAYIAYLLTAYNDIYNWNSLDKFFQAPYAAMMPGLFNGSKSWGEVINTLPGSLAEMMHPDFTINYFNNQESMVWDALRENTLLNWEPEAPLHFFHGDCDNISYCLNAINALEAFSSCGADVQLTLLEGENHETGGPPAINGAINWIEDFYPDL